MSDINLCEKLLRLDSELKSVIASIAYSFEKGQLIQYRNNPAVKALQTARIKQVMSWGLIVERYKPDGTKMRGDGYITGLNLCTVSLIPEPEVF